MKGSNSPAKGLGSIPSMMKHRGDQRVSGTDLYFRKVTFIAVWRVGWKEAILYARMSARRTLYQNKQQMIKVEQEDDRKIRGILRDGVNEI